MPLRASNIIPTMKTISLLTLVAVAISFGACAKEKTAPTKPAVSKNVKGFKK
ncbi:MAG: hypothetical protein RLZZ399_1205 [Verrucomicrobiota bacterium]